MSKYKDKVLELIELMAENSHHQMAKSFDGRSAPAKGGMLDAKAVETDMLLDKIKKLTDVSFSCVVKTQRRWSKKIYKTELTKTKYNNQVLGKYRVDPQRAGLTLIVELTWSNLGLKGVLNERK